MKLLAGSGGKSVNHGSMRPKAVAIKAAVSQDEHCGSSSRHWLHSRQSNKGGLILRQDLLLLVILELLLETLELLLRLLGRLVRIRRVKLVPELVEHVRLLALAPG